MQQKIFYKIRRSSRIKKIYLSVDSNGEIVIALPEGVDKKIAEVCLWKKIKWILKKINSSSRRNTWKKHQLNSQENYLLRKKEAEKLITERLQYFCKRYDFKFNRFTVRNQKTRWGSCSSQKNLNFNYRLLYLSKEQVDYIIVHELCHLKIMNHSKEFWKMVEAIIPNYITIRKELREVEF